MNCYEKILETLPIEIHARVEKDFTLSGEILKQINSLGKNECETISQLISFNYIPSMNFETFLTDCLNSIRTPKLEKKVNDLESSNMWERWNNRGQVSKKELSLIIGRSVDVIERYCRKSQSVFLKSYSNGDGSNVYFKKADWDEYEGFLER